MNADPAGTLAQLRDWHAEIDRLTGGLAARLGTRITCHLGCADCCVDNLTVFPIEAQRIRQDAVELLRTGRPHPPGACAFQDERGGCRIHAQRPYVCRTQGLPLRWFGDDPEHGPVEYRDICPRNDHGPVLEGLPAAGCWLIGPYEEQLRALQGGFGRLTDQRVSLRGLWREGLG